MSRNQVIRAEWRDAQDTAALFLMVRLGAPDKISSGEFAEWAAGTGTLWVALGRRPCSVFLYDKDAGGHYRFRVQIDHCEGVLEDKLALEIVADAVLRMRRADDEVDDADSL